MEAVETTIVDRLEQLKEWEDVLKYPIKDIAIAKERVSQSIANTGIADKSEIDDLYLAKEEFEAVSKVIRRLKSLKGDKVLVIGDYDYAKDLKFKEIKEKKIEEKNENSLYFRSS